MISLCKNGGEIIPDSLFNSMYHSGDSEFISHLIASDNIVVMEIGKWWLFKPVDYAYAENWVLHSCYVQESSKPRLRHAIRRISKDSELWFGINKEERLLCVNT